MRSTLASLAALVLIAATAPPARSQDRVSGLGLRDLSVGGDFVADLSHRGPTLPDSSRFTIREIDVGARRGFGSWTGALRLRAADRQGVALAEAHVSGPLVAGFQGRAGRFLLPFGTLNEIHRHAMPTVEAPYAHQRFVGDVSTSATGAALRRSFGRDRYDITAAVVDALSEIGEGTALDNPQESLSGLGYVLRARGGWRVSGVSVSSALSAMTGRRLHPLSDPVGAGDRRIDAVVARQSVLGFEAVFGGGARADDRFQQWHAAPWSLSAQVLYQVNEPESSLRQRIPANAATGGPFYEGPDRDVMGGSVMLRLPVHRRWSLTARGDRVAEPLSTLGVTQAASGHLEWQAPSDIFVSGAYELRSQTGRTHVHRIFVRARFVVGEQPERGF
jgi:hypothetical protein